MVFSEITLKKLKTEYEKAKRLNKDTFVFEDATLYLDYAKYLIEYLENEFNEVRNEEPHPIKNRNH